MTSEEEGWRFDPLDILQERIRNNQTHITIFTGPLGSGKSMSALQFCELLDPTFDVDRVAFTIPDFLGIVRKLKRAGDKGRMAMLDEASVGANARKAMSNQNTDFTDLMAVYRYLQIPTAMTLPNLRMIDRNVRRLFNYHVKTVKIDRKRSLCKTRFMVIDSQDDWQDTIKRYFFRVQNPVTRERIKLTAVYFRLPSKDLIDAYEEKKDDFVDAMIERQIARWGGGDDDEPGETPQTPKTPPERRKRGKVPDSGSSAFNGDPFFG
jgi:hypothetical protein